MRAYVLPKDSRSLDQLRIVERPAPVPGPGQVAIRVRAASLNYRDLLIATGRYFNWPTPRELVPLSDGAGEVAAVGEGVTRFKVGDRVAGCFAQADPRGPASGPELPTGSPLDGVLAEMIVLHADGVVAIPPSYSFEEAACLPCAGVTAWNALFGTGKPLRAGETVLALGTGGVSVWATQLAAAAGARVIVTSSSDAKLARARALGAAEGINYRTTPDWDEAVMRLTEGRGVDCVIEVGGAGTLSHSFRSISPGGKIALIGVLAGQAAEAVEVQALRFRRGSLHGILVGDRPMFEALVRAVEENAIRPVIDRVFDFEQARAAYDHLASGDFMGKIVISL